MRKVRRFFNHYKRTRLLMLQKIKIKLLEYGYKAEYNNFDVEFYIGKKLYFIELFREQIRLFDDKDFEFYYSNINQLFNKIKELRDKEL
ncbi:hypothetical protein [Brachyspira alvinipulli]|uniref:hypothetical protein n=1 Tax=Brachyspira alvinipulli TaxID=84379 RepID=UPI000489D671|nr:hypothetical protein [Brachyspira alvinipulli]